MSDEVTQSDREMAKEWRWAMYCPDGCDPERTVNSYLAELSEDFARARIAGWNAAVDKAAEVAEWSAMVPPDGGCPTEAETAVADEAALRIRTLRIEETKHDHP